MSSPTTRSDPFHGVFRLDELNGQWQLLPAKEAPGAIPDPQGRLLRIATLDVGSPAICPACTSKGRGGFMSFVDDLRMAYACPSCAALVWLQGA